MNELAELYARLYLDQDVPVQLAGMLRARGLDTLTTLDAEMLGQADEDQLIFATREGRTLVTHNREDFEALHADWLMAGRNHAGIIVSPQRRNLRHTADRI